MVAEVPVPGCLCSTLCNGLLPWGLAAAGLVLQVCLAANLAAAGPLQGRYTRPPLLMALLP